MQTGKTLHVDVNTRGLWELRQWENEGTYIHECVYERHKDDICTQFVVVSVPVRLSVSGSAQRLWTSFINHLLCLKDIVYFANIVEATE